MKKDILVIASHNVGKISEIRDMLNKYKLNLKISSDFNIEEPDEVGKNFEENALLIISSPQKTPQNSDIKFTLIFIFGFI